MLWWIITFYLFFFLMDEFFIKSGLNKFLFFVIGKIKKEVGYCCKVCKVTLPMECYYYFQ